MWLFSPKRYILYICSFYNNTACNLCINKFWFLLYHLYILNAKQKLADQKYLFGLHPWKGSKCNPIYFLLPVVRDVLWNILRRCSGEFLLKSSHLKDFLNLSISGNPQQPTLLQKKWWFVQDVKDTVVCQVNFDSTELSVLSY